MRIVNADEIFNFVNSYTAAAVPKEVLTDLLSDVAFVEMPGAKSIKDVYVIMTALQIVLQEFADVMAEDFDGEGE